LNDGITRSEPCPQCGTDFVWTQNAWTQEDAPRAAYVCANGHVIDPNDSRQCPHCGVHDTRLLSEAAGRQQFRCSRCGESFVYPRDADSTAPGTAE
jgi:predicted RNA-binding Zn-ribbon protein involved in translation (DUF1610 family)